MSVVEIFAGAGGFATGLRLAGFEAKALLDYDRKMCDTLISNFGKRKVILADVSKFNFREKFGRNQTDLLAGGPPCQPFSAAGLRLGEFDSRDQWPNAIRAVKEMQPKAFVFENVFGLLSPNNVHYFSIIKDSFKKLGYTVIAKKVNASHYGVPQRRRRVFLIGFNNQAAMKKFQFPQPSHTSKNALTLQQAIANLPPFGSELAKKMMHVPMKVQAKAYKGHCGSPLDRPAKTVLAGERGPGGGNNMINYGNGNLRHFTPREAARLQTFPDSYILPQNLNEAHRQIGNAVPVELARRIGVEILAALGASG